MANESVEQLYNAALLGKATSESLAEAQLTGTDVHEAQRKAAVLAGVASGKIKGSQLSRADAAGLGGSLHHGGGGFLGTLFHPFESAGKFVGHEASLAGKEIGQFGESLGKLPQGLLALAKKGVALQASKNLPEGQGVAEQDVGKIGHQIEQAGEETLHPLHHPFGAALNLASLASLGSGSLVKGAGAVARASTEGSNLARAASKIAKLGSTEGRPGINVSPGFDQKTLEDIKALNPNANVQGATIPRYYRAESPFTKYAWQKPLDTAVSKLKKVPVPGATRNLGEMVGDYYGNRLINRTRAEAQAGLNESFATSPVKDVLESRAKMMAKDPETGAMEWEAMMLGKTAGIDSVPKLDEYINEIRKGATPDGHIMLPQEKKMMEYRANQLYQDPKFRWLVEHPTDEMKAAAYHFRRLNVHIATLAQIDPSVSEEAGMFGRLRNLTTKTTDELRHELPTWAQNHSPFARGLQAIQDTILGRETAEHAPSPEALASYIPDLDHSRVADMLKKAVKSFQEDRAGGSQLDRQANPDYIAGTTLYQKVAQGLHGLGMEPEQASSFASGVPLGGPESEIIPTYVPSAGGKGMQFGVQPGGLKEKLTRLSLTPKHDPLQYWQAKRPFKPRNIQSSTIGITPMGFAHDAEYNSFMNGSMRLDPEMIVRNAYNIQRAIIGKKLNEPMIDRLAVKADDGTPRYFKNREEMEGALGHIADHYTFIPVNVWKDFFNEDVQLQFDMANEVKSLEGESPDAVMKSLEELAEESAQRFVSGEVQKAGMSGGRFGNGVALPNSFVKTILEHRKIAESGGGIARLESRIISRWKYMQLTMMPAWLLRTSIGHGIIALVDGTMNPKYWIQASHYTRERPIQEEALRGIDFGKKYGDGVLNPQGIPMGVKQGGMISELHDVGRGKQQIGFLPQQIGRAVHTTTNWQRVAIALRKYDVNARQRLAELGQAFDHPGGFWNIKNIDAVLDPAWQAEVLKTPDLPERILDQVSQVSYTFGDMAPWERRLVKYGLPFWGWYKFISKFVWKMPFNYPGRAEAMHMLGNIGNEDVQGLGPIPPYLESAMWFGNHPESQKYLNMYGMNPFADVANPFNRRGALEGLVRMGQFSPIIQSAMAAAGINPITGGSMRVSPAEGYETDRYGNLIDLASGEEVENVGNVNPIQRGIGTFLRAFPEVRIPELAATGGNPVFPESIPFIHELPIGVRPESRHGGAFGEGLESEFGLQMRHMNLASKQRQLLKNVQEARKKQIKTLRKEAQRRSEPTP